MADDVKSNIKQLSRDFKKLPGKVQKRVLAKVNRRGAALIAKKAKELAPMDTGKGKKQVKVRALKKVNKSNERGHTVIFDTPKGSGLAPYLYFQEVGTNRGIKPLLFLDSAFDVMRNRAEDKIMEDFGSELEKELIKLGWKR